MFLCFSRFIEKEIATYSNKGWLKIESYKEWLMEDEDGKFAGCNVCTHPKNRFSLSNMGEQALKSHMKGKKHLKRFAERNNSTQPKLSSFFQTGQAKSTSQSTSTIQSTSTNQSTSKPGTIDGFAFDDKDVTNAEIIWTLKSVSANFSLRSCDGLAQVFQNMFPGNLVAKNFTFNKDKCSYYINYGIGPHYKSILVDQIKSSPCYSTSFDESLNVVIQQEQMDIHITFWNSDTKRVESRYYDTTFMGHTTANDLKEAFNDKMKPFSASNMLQVGMDGPNVNWLFYDKISNERDNLALPELLHTGSCGLHILHGSFKTGASATDWNLGKILKALHKVFDDSPARRADFTGLTVTTFQCFSVYLF